MKNQNFVSYALVISGAVILLTGAPEALAQSQSGSSSVSADRAASRTADNTGKKLAIANISRDSEDGDKKANQSMDSIKKAVEDFSKSVSEDYLPKVKSKNLTIKVPEVEIPPNLQDLCDDCITGGQQMAKFAREHAVELGAILTKYIQQMTDPTATKITPVSSPYSAASETRVVPSDFGIRKTNKYFTPEGRLKTVVQR